MLEITIVMRRGWAQRTGLLVAACAVGAGALLVPAGAGAADVPFTARGSVEQVHVTGLKPGARTKLIGPKGRRVAVKRAAGMGPA